MLPLTSKPQDAAFHSERNCEHWRNASRAWAAAVDGTARSSVVKEKHLDVQSHRSD